MSKDKREKRGPESARYQEMKGERIRVWPAQAKTIEETWVGVLEWVDTYTIGVAIEDDHVLPSKDTLSGTSIIYKDSLRIDCLEQ